MQSGPTVRREHMEKIILEPKHMLRTWRERLDRRARDRRAGEHIHAPPALRQRIGDEDPRHLLLRRIGAVGPEDRELDGKLIFKGEIKKAPGNSKDPDACCEIILFTDSESTLLKIDKNDWLN